MNDTVSVNGARAWAAKLRTMGHNVSLINNGFLVVAGVITATSALPLNTSSTGSVVMGEG